MKITISKLLTGLYLIKGEGNYDSATLFSWPCKRSILEKSFNPMASTDFKNAAIKEMYLAASPPTEPNSPRKPVTE